MASPDRCDDRFTVGILKDQWNQRAGSLRREQSSRIFEADARYVEFGGLANSLKEIVVGVFRRYRINNVENCFEAEPIGAGHRFRPVRWSIGRIRGAQFGDPVGGESLEPEFANSGRGDLKRQHGAAADGAQRCFLRPLRHQSGSFPEIFF